MDTPSRYWHAMSDAALLQMLGSYVHATRLAQNRTQLHVAEAAGINRSTLVQLEKGKGGTMLTFIQVLRALQHLHLFAEFQPQQQISPMLLAELELKKRKRASRQQPKKAAKKSSW